MTLKEQIAQKEQELAKLRELEAHGDMTEEELMRKEVDAFNSQQSWIIKAHASITNPDALSILGGWYKDNKHLLEIISNLKAQLATNKETFTRKEIGAPSTWFASFNKTKVQKYVWINYYNQSSIYSDIITRKCEPKELKMNFDLNNIDMSCEPARTKQLLYPIAMKVSQKEIMDENNKPKIIDTITYLYGRKDLETLVELYSRKLQWSLSIYTNQLEHITNMINAINSILQ